jgi:hypothetical protein
MLHKCAEILTDDVLFSEMFPEQSDNCEVEI